MSLSDPQKIIMHFCRQALKAGRGQDWISRDDVLNGKLAPPGAPQGAFLALMMAALTMPEGLLEWSADQQKFRLSDQFVSMIYLREADDA